MYRIATENNLLKSFAVFLASTCNFGVKFCSRQVRWKFRAQGTLAVSCAAKMESESGRFTDELNIYRSYLDGRPSRALGAAARRERARLMSINCGKIHKYRDNYMERAGKYTYEGHRQALLPISRRHVRYQLSFKVSSRRSVRTCPIAEQFLNRDHSFIYSFVPSFIIHDVREDYATRSSTLYVCMCLTVNRIIPKVVLKF